MLVARDIQGNVGQIVPMEIVLEKVTTGVSGFQLTMQVADPSVAIIESRLPTGFFDITTPSAPPTAIAAKT